MLALTAPWRILWTGCALVGLLLVGLFIRHVSFVWFVKELGGSRIEPLRETSYRSVERVRETGRFAIGDSERNRCA
jgi:hypothetical protein